MSDAVTSSAEDLEPLPKRLKLSSEEDEAAAAASGEGGARTGDEGETPSTMLGGLVCKFLKEADVGITEYVSSQPGFFAILKQRFENFIHKQICKKLLFAGIPISLFVRFPPMEKW